jgi:ABC-type nitrate/sulfonate/bicarbonate transport system permease component
VLALGTWEIASRSEAVPSRHIPPASDVLSELSAIVGQDGFWQALGSTMGQWGAGMAIAAAIAIPLGLLMGSVEAIWRALRPTIEFFRPVPGVALLPLAVLLFGMSGSSVVALIVFGTVWSLLVLCMLGASDVQGGARDAARVFRLTPLQRGRWIVLPSALPYVATGLRIASATALILAVGAELVVGVPGLGHEIGRAQTAGDVTTMYALILASGAIGIAIHAVFSRFERHFLRWRHAALELSVTAVLVVVAWLYLEGDRGVAWTSIPNMFEAFREAWLFDRISTDVLPSLARLTLGFVTAVVLGTAVGLAIGSWRTVRLVTQPVISFLRSLPGVALLPLSIVLFGIGTTQKVLVIAFICAWPIVLNVADGIAELDRTMLASAQAYRIRGWDHVRFVLAPALMPRLFAGMKISLSLAVLMLVVSEMVAATNGIGFFVWQAQLTFSIPDMWAGIILLGLLGYVLNAALQATERRVCHWQAALAGRGS